MYLTVLGHATEAASCTIVAPMRTIHRWPLDVQWLRSPLLMGVNGLSRRQLRHLQIVAARRFLAAATEI